MSLTAFPEHSRLGVVLTLDETPDHLEKGIREQLTALGVKIMHVDVQGVGQGGSVHFGFKLHAMLMSPFSHTIFLDADTWACAPITGLFDMLKRFDFVGTQVRFHLECATRVALLPRAAEFKLIPPIFLRPDERIIHGAPPGPSHLSRGGASDATR